MSESEKPKEMRELDDKERKTHEKSLLRNKEEFKGMMFAKHQAELMLNEGIDVDIIEQRKRYTKQLSAVESKMEELDFAISTGEKQLKEGVEVRPPVELPKMITAEIPEDTNYFDVQDALEKLGCSVMNKETKE